MSEASERPSGGAGAARAPARELRHLFLTLFLRGRGARGLRKDRAPKSVGSKLAFNLVLYALFGTLVLMFAGQSIFTLSLYAHAITLMFLGMFVAASAGEVLFNKEEADILLHRPVAPRTLLWAKISVLVQISLWLAGAFNLVTFCAGVGVRDGGWLFPVAHAISMVLVALFCAGCVVLGYQLCLRWFGRERLDALMTTVQVLFSILIVLGSQLAPQLILRSGGRPLGSAWGWWVALLPPAWFAGFDDALAGTGAAGSWALAAVGVTITAVVLWLAFGRLAREYESGLHALGEVPAGPRRRGRRLWLARLLQAPPLSWWLRDSVTRASFLLTAAYLARDRDVKLRLYPSVVPVLMMPIILLLRNGTGGDVSFAMGLAGSYVGFVPLLALDLLRYSQQWQASDVFRAAPIPGPAPFCHGARSAVLCLLALPALVFLFVTGGFLIKDLSRLALLLPGIFVIPLYAMFPCLGGKAVPLSLPIDESKSAGRSLAVLGVMLVSSAVSGLATWSWSGGWFGWLLIVEASLVGGIYLLMNRSVAAVRWPSLE